MKVTTIGDCVVFSNNAMYLENILDEIRRQFDVYSVTNVHTGSGYRVRLVVTASMRNMC